MANDPIFPMFTEKDFQRSVIELAHIHHWHVYAIPDSRQATLAGFPDLTLWRAETLLFVELKLDKGKVSAVQQECHEQLRQTGATVLVWRPRDWNEIETVLGRWPDSEGV